MARLLLTDAHLRGIKPNDPRKRLTDGDGLYLLLSVKGGSHGWRFDYSHSGKRKTLSLGTYPDTTLSMARKKADDARRLRCPSNFVFQRVGIMPPVAERCVR
jgi:hypothetical protein